MCGKQVLLLSIPGSAVRRPPRCAESRVYIRVVTSAFWRPALRRSPHGLCRGASPAPSGAYDAVAPSSFQRRMPVSMPKGSSARPTVCTGLGKVGSSRSFRYPVLTEIPRNFLESASVQANAATWNAGSGGALKLYIRSTASGAARVSVQRQAFDENLNMRRKLAGSKPASEAG